jgi:hypothetical protein
MISAGEVNPKAKETSTPGRSARASPVPPCRGAAIRKRAREDAAIQVLHSRFAAHSGRHFMRRNFAGRSFLGAAGLHTSIQPSALGIQPTQFRHRRIKAMYRFAIDVGEENSYTPGSAQGCECREKDL